MKFDKVTAKNFMQFSSLEIELAKEGLCLIQGESDETYSDSNMAGKTTAVVHSLCWGMFGRVLGDLKADEIVNDVAKKDCQVIIRLAFNDMIYHIVRNRNHKKFKNELQFFSASPAASDFFQNKLTKSSNSETQAEINKLFNLDWEIFTNTIVFGQGSIKRFSEYTDTERKALLDKLLKLGGITDLQQKTKVKIKDIKTDIKLLDNTLSTLVVGITETQERLSELKVSQGTFASTQETKSATIKQEINRLIVRKTSIDIIDLKKQKTLLDKIDVMLASLTTDKNNLVVAEASIKEKELILAGKKQLLKASYSTKAGILNKINSIENDNRGDCDSCGQAITDNSKDTFIVKYKQELLGITNEINSISSEIEILSAEIDGERTDFSSKLVTINGKLEKYATFHREVSERIATSGVNLTLKNELLEQIEAKYLLLKDVAEETNPYADLVAKEQQKNIKYKNDKFLSDEKLSGLQTNLASHTFWEEAFSNTGIKSLLLDNIVPYLSERTNYYLQHLTNGEIKVVFATEKELSSGKETKDKLDIQLFKNNKEYSFGKTSGGERKRIDFAISLALQSLLTTTMNINVSVFDEVFDSLDETGVSTIISLLNDEIANKDSIFVISHNASLKDLFKNVLTVKKKKGVSTLCRTT